MQSWIFEIESLIVHEWEMLRNVSFVIIIIISYNSNLFFLGRMEFRLSAINKSNF